MSRMFWDTAAMLDQRAAERRAKAYSRPMTRRISPPPGRTLASPEHHDASIAIRMDFASSKISGRRWKAKTVRSLEYVSTLSIGKTKLRDAVRLAYLDGETDGARSYAATAWVVKGRVP